MDESNDAEPPGQTEVCVDVAGVVSGVSALDTVPAVDAFQQKNIARDVLEPQFNFCLHRFTSVP